MKRIGVLFLAIAFLAGTVPIFAQDSPSDKSDQKQKKKRKRKRKKKAAYNPNPVTARVTLSA